MRANRVHSMKSPSSCWHERKRFQAAWPPLQSFRRPCVVRLRLRIANPPTQVHCGVFASSRVPMLVRRFSARSRTRAFWRTPNTVQFRQSPALRHAQIGRVRARWGLSFAIGRYSSTSRGRSVMPTRRQTGSATVSLCSRRTRTCSVLPILEIARPFNRTHTLHYHRQRSLPQPAGRGIGAMKAARRDAAREFQSAPPTVHLKTYSTERQPTNTPLTGCAVEASDNLRILRNASSLRHPKREIVRRAD